MYKFRLSIQALIIAYLCSALVACGGGSSSASTTTVTTYTITTTATTGGSVTPENTTVNSGQTAKFTVSASNGYTVQSVTGCSGTLSGNTYITGPVTANCTVNASFIPITYTVTDNAGPGGTITPASTAVPSGKTAMFTVVANSGNVIQTVTGCGGSLSGATYTTGPVTSDCTITATFTAQPSPTNFTVTATAGFGGTITPASTTVSSGRSAIFDVIANSGYSIQSVAGCGGSLSGALYTTSPVTSDCTIRATFSAQPSPTEFTITATAGLGGTITPASTTATSDRSVVFDVVANSGYAIQSVVGCGGSLSGATYTTAPVTSDCTVTASFTSTYTVTATVGSSAAGGTITPPSVVVRSGQTAAFNVDPTTGYAALSVTGCGGILSGSVYTTGAIIANCSVEVMFKPSWTWETGSALASQYLKQAEGRISPAARQGAASWTDSSGDFWMFGGVSEYNPSGTAGYLGNYYLNDIWKYSPGTNQWGLEGGSETTDQSGVYGTQGAPASTNTPGARSGAVTWIDGNGNLWLFGGAGLGQTGYLGYLNDLWMYSPATLEWTWEGGAKLSNQPGVYGLQGVPSVTNAPGARSGAVAWTDSNGNLWMFGGVGDSGVGDLNDLWEYFPLLHEWAWEGGSTNADQSGVYGTQGVAAVGNEPGARTGAVAWVGVDGNFWLFGGDGYGSNSTFGALNDLWMYSPVTHEWTWEGGSQLENQPGVYGIQGMPAATNVPSARSGSVAWADANGNLWLFGGTMNNGVENLNDLWMYSPAMHEWTWESGSQLANQAGSYGTAGLAATANVPGARQGSVAWTDASGNLWLFGGSGYDLQGTAGVLNDMWMYPKP